MLSHSLGGEMKSTNKTHVEIRNEKIDRELFEITEDMRKAMELARKENIRQIRLSSSRE